MGKITSNLRTSLGTEIEKVVSNPCALVPILFNTQSEITTIVIIIPTAIITKNMIHFIGLAVDGYFFVTLPVVEFIATHEDRNKTQSEGEFQESIHCLWVIIKGEARF